LDSESRFRHVRRIGSARFPANDRQVRIGVHRPPSSLRFQANYPQLVRAAISDNGRGSVSGNSNRWVPTPFRRMQQRSQLRAREIGHRNRAEAEPSPNQPTQEPRLRHAVGRFVGTTLAPIPARDRKGREAGQSGLTKTLSTASLIYLPRSSPGSTTSCAPSGRSCTRHRRSSPASKGSETTLGRLAAAADGLGADPPPLGAR
jgi:hypothetical protein